MKSGKTLTILRVCCVCLTVGTASWADFVGVVSEFKTDANTVFLCGEGFGLTVCNVSIQFDEDDDRLLSVAFSDLQVMNGDVPGVFFQHLFAVDTPYDCYGSHIFPDLICDSYVTIGQKCVGIYGTVTDADFDSDEFNSNGHIVGGWFNNNPPNGLGDAFGPINPDGKVLILHLSVAVGLSLDGSATVLWQNIGDPTVFENAVKIVCEAGCPDDYPCDDGDPCTEDDVCNNQICQGTPVDCDDGNECTVDFCDPASGCVHIPNDASCDDGVRCTVDACSVASGCENTPDNANCDDGNSCTTDTCDTDVGCLNQMDVDCNDNNDCTIDSCDPEDGCMHISECTGDDQCDTDNLCSFDRCTPEGCCESVFVECPPGEFCDPDTGSCVDVPSGYLDIIPGKCPNRLQRNGQGFIKVSLVSAAVAQDLQAFNACEVDVSTIQLCRADGTWGCAQPANNPAPRCKDRATPFLGELCGCHGLRKDGLDDLDMRFKVADLVNNLGLADMPAGVSVELELTALTNDGQSVIARDCVELGRDLGPNP